MAKPYSTAQQQTTNKIYANLSFITAVILLVFGVLALWASQFTMNMVKSELAAQKIYFPAKNSPALDAKIYPDLQKYAGELVDTPAEARAYANSYIGRHLKKVADGKVYAEVSAEAMKDPTNTTLQQQKQTLFQGETLRAILLSTGYGYGTMGQLAGIAAYVLFIASAVLFAITLILGRRARA